MGIQFVLFWFCFWFLDFVFVFVFFSFFGFDKVKNLVDLLKYNQAEYKS